MLVLDTISDCKNGVVTVQRFQAGHLSLQTGTVITLCLLPSTTMNALPPMKEIVVSPIRFQSWQNLIRISGIFYDRPGIVSTVANALRREGLDIVYEESATVENGKYHEIEVIADSNEIYRRYREHDSHTLALLPRLERRLKGILIDDLVLTPGKTPRIKVRPMEALQRAWTAAAIQRESEGLTVARTTISNGQFKLPDLFLEALKQKSPRAILVSDTKNRVLRMLIPDEGVDFTYIRVVHQDIVGALARITDALSRAFNAVLTLTRLKEQDEQNDIELLLYHHHYNQASDSDERTKIAESLLAHEDLADLGISVSYPKKVGAIGMSPQPPLLDKNIVLPKPEFDFSSYKIVDKSTMEILQAKIAEYESMKKRQFSLFTKNFVQSKLDAAIELLNYEIPEGYKVNSVPTIFLSYIFSSPERAKIVKNIVERKKSAIVIDGANPRGKPLFRDVIKERIRTSQGFIGIWGNEIPSPWLIWELAIAHAYDVPVQLLVHKDIASDAHNRIFPEYLHEAFVDLELRNVVEQMWPIFRETISKHSRSKL